MHVVDGGHHLDVSALMMFHENVLLCPDDDRHEEAYIWTMTFVWIHSYDDRWELLHIGPDVITLQNCFACL